MASMAASAPSGTTASVPLTQRTARGALGEVTARTVPAGRRGGGGGGVPAASAPARALRAARPRARVRRRAPTAPGLAPDPLEEADGDLEGVQRERLEVDGIEEARRRAPALVPPPGEQRPDRRRPLGTRLDGVHDRVLEVHDRVAVAGTPRARVDERDRAVRRDLRV